MVDIPTLTSNDPTEIQRFIEERLTGPMGVSAYSVNNLPNAADYYHAERMYFIGVNDETGGVTLAYSDGTNWRRVQDRAVVS